MHHPFAHFYRLAVPAALIAAGLAFGASGAHAGDGDKPRRTIDVEIHKGTLEIVGSSSADALALRLKAGKPEKLEIDAGDDGKADFRVKRRKFERIGIELRGGADSLRIDESNGAFTDAIPTTIDGGADDDALSGGRGREVLIAGDGNDAVDGNQGNDVAFLGAGDDRFTWDPGDGSDVVEGQTGEDELDFNGSAASERFDASANGRRARFTRDVGNITMDLDDVEKIDTDALGGADAYNAGDLSGTDVTELDTDLAGALGGTTADGEADTVTLAGSNDRDFAEAFGSAASAVVVGLPTFAQVRHSEPADKLVINALGGDDNVSASSLPADAAGLVVDGGNGGDTIFGGRGRDVLLGGADGDFVDGNQGDDFAPMGAGLDIFRWDPGDGSDVVEGQSGPDVMLFNGSGANELFEVSANGQRARFTRDVGSIVMDLDGVERIETLAFGGADTYTANDLSGTAVRALTVNAGAVLGSPATDGQPDSVIVNGTNGDDAIAVAGSAGTVNVSGLAATLAITRAEAALDTLSINGLGGADTLDDSGLAPNTIGLSFTQ